MPTDAELLRRYLESDSQEAFSALVQRHLPFTYSAALRHTGGNVHQAQEIAQCVFTLLARKARSLARHPVLIGWLCTTTYYTAAKLRRARQRRFQAETQAVSENSSPDLDWERLRPVVDELLLELKERDWTAVLLRFFSAHTYGEIGEKLGLTENGARMRVDRALDALRVALKRRGVTSSAAVLGTLLSTQAIAAVPERLGNTIAASAMAAKVVSGGTFVFMGSTLVKVGVALGVVAAVSVGFFSHHQSQEEIQRLRDELSRTEHDRLHVQAAQRTVPAAGVVTAPMAPLPVAGVTDFHVSATRVPVQLAPDLQRAFTPLGDLRDAGIATPADAVQTVVWAVLNGDSRLPDMVFLNKAARAATIEIMESLTPSERELYDTPEKVAALYLAKYILAKTSKVLTVKIDAVSLSDSETASVSLLSGEQPGPTSVSLQLTPKGWLWKVKPTVMEAAKQEFLAPKSSPGMSATNKP